MLFDRFIAAIITVALLLGVIQYQGHVIASQRKLVRLGAIDNAIRMKCEIEKRQCFRDQQKLQDKLDAQGFGCPTPPEARGPAEYPMPPGRQRAQGRM